MAPASFTKLSAITTQQTNYIQTNNQTSSGHMTFNCGNAQK